MPILNQSSAASEEPRVVKKIEFAGLGAVIQLIGFLLLFVLFPVGLFVGIGLLITGSLASRKFYCSECKNLIEKSSRLCPSCKASFKNQ